MLHYTNRRWLKFVENWLYASNEVFTVYSKFIDTLTNEEDDKEGMVDMFFPYKLCNGVRDERINAKKIDNFVIQLEKSFTLHIPLFIRAQVYPTWLVRDEFIRFMGYLSNPSSNILDNDEIDRIVVSLWGDLNFDLFLQTLLSPQQNILSDYNDKTGSLKGFKETPHELATHIRRNLFWLWILTVAFFFIHDIFQIWDESSLRTPFLFSLQGQEKKIIETYSHEFLPYSIKAGIAEKPMLPNVSGSSMIYQDDINRLMYHLIDPYNPIPKKDKAFGRTPIEFEMPVENVTGSRIIQMKSYYMDNEDANSTLYKTWVTKEWLEKQQ
jgi:hypothetical protein